MVALTALAVARADAALAAPVGPNPKTIGSAHTAVSSCGSLSGIGISWTVTATVVTTIALTSIPAGCNGGALSLTLVGTGNAALASIAPTAITGTSQSFSSITGSATATAVTGAHISIVGP